MKISFPTNDAIKRLVGKIKRFDYNDAGYYEHEDGEGSIDGKEVLQQILDQIPGVKSADVQPETTTIDISSGSTKAFMMSSGFRASDYDLEDAEEDIESNIIGLLASIKREYQIGVDPYSYVVENEPEPEEEPESEEEFEESRRSASKLIEKVIKGTDPSKLI